MQGMINIREEYQQLQQKYAADCSGHAPWEKITTPYVTDTVEH